MIHISCMEVLSEIISNSIKNQFFIFDNVNDGKMLLPTFIKY